MTAGQLLQFTAGMPLLPRLDPVRMGVVVIGPGMPSLSQADESKVPASVRASIPNGEGAVLVTSPEDQSTCDHVFSGAMKNSSKVTDGRCHFHEPYADSHSWVLIDNNVSAVDAGLYHFAVFTTTNTPAKVWFACCDWPEDFSTPYPMPDTNCPFCGTSEKFGGWSSHFYEQKSMTQYGGFPPYEICESGSAPAVPSEEQCPAVTTIDGSQPANCPLGCSQGQCHSHNILGECKYNVAWITPRAMVGSANVTSLQIFLGETIVFSSAGHIWPHNLIDMKTSAKLEACDFENTTEVGNVEEMRVGKDVKFDKPGTYFYSCQITGHCNIGQKLIVTVKDVSEGMRCHDHEVAPPPACEDGQVQAYVLDNQEYAAAKGQCSEFCITDMALNWIANATKASCNDAGYTTVVKEEMVQPSGSRAMMKVTVMSKNSACEEGEVLAYLLDNQEYAAARGQCSEFCTTQIALNRIANATQGSCKDGGFDLRVKDEEVQPSGSPTKIRVTIMASRGTCPDGGIRAYVLDNEEYGAARGQCSEFCSTQMALNWISGASMGGCKDAGFDTVVKEAEVQPSGSPQKMMVTVMGKETSCHCHSYEEIKCGAAGDTLYAEHIDEIVEFCAGVISGADDDCPYKCFQPFEVLHLHYMECASRRADSTYIEVNKTSKCHRAAMATSHSQCDMMPEPEPEPEPNSTSHDHGHDHGHGHGNDHDHGHGHVHDDGHDSTCAAGQVKAYVLDNEEYGAALGQCSEFCSPQVALNWIPSVTQGACKDAGYDNTVQTVEVQPTGSSSKMMVTVMGKSSTLAPTPEPTSAPAEITSIAPTIKVALQVSSAFLLHWSSTL